MPSPKSARHRQTHVPPSNQGGLLTLFTLSSVVLVAQAVPPAIHDFLRGLSESPAAAKLGWFQFVSEVISILFSFCYQQNWVRLVFLIFGFLGRPAFILSPVLTSTPRLL